MGIFERFKKREIKLLDTPRDDDLDSINYHKVRYFYNRQANAFYTSHNGNQEMTQIQESHLPEPVRTYFYYEPPDTTRQQSRYPIEAA